MSELALDQRNLESETNTDSPQETQNLPAEESSPNEGNVVTESQNPVSRFVEQPAVKRALPAIIGGVAILVCVLFYLWISAPGQRPVYPGMTESDRQTAYQLLSNSGYDVRIDISSGEVLVENDRYHEARMLLASQNIPKAASLGSLGSLVEQGSLTTSRFMEQVSYRAAMENELAKSIGQISTISNARVHIAESQQSVFVRNQTPSKASVVVKPYPGRVVSKSQINAIVHLVSSSIPYLSRENVTVVDNMGQLLTDTDGDSALALTTAQTEHRTSVEANYQQRIQQMLSAIVGLGNVRTEVNVSVNFTEVESTFEEYDREGNGPRTRSESLQLEKDSQPEAAGVPGGFSNEAPESPAFTQTTSTIDSRQNQADDVSSSSTTRNYEIDREIRYVKQQVGSIERISVAVVVNENAYLGEEEQTDKIKLDQDLARIEDIVRGAVGYSESRGDVVTVVASKFARPVEELDDPWYLEPDKLDGFVRIAAVFGILFFVYIFIARPFIKSMQARDALEVPMEMGDPDGISDEERQLVEMGDVETIQDVTARLKPKAVGIPAEYLDTSQPYDQKVALMRFLVKDDVGRVSNLLKRWIAEEI